MGAMKTTASRETLASEHSESAAGADARHASPTGGGSPYLRHRQPDAAATEQHSSSPCRSQPAFSLSRIASGASSNSW